MKLYECPRNVLVKTEDGNTVKFHHVDGMYSYCTTEGGQVLHLAAWTEVEILKEQDNEQSI
jgi:hypothetical protein